ncbi:MAG: hypothetical protein GX321_09015 [Clostridiales bacterium]|nr:hypothetical protein [Clostridiales bacterium]
MKENSLEFDYETTITTEEIRQILEKYRIGKKPLAKLLGWGETTIIRYMDGDIPTGEYSDKLKKILESPEYYYDLLIKRKDCLTGVAFRKSRRAALLKIMSSKIYVVTYYIINKSDADICPGYLQYLLYYIQAFSLSLYGRELFQEDYIVNAEHIPFPKLFDDMRRCGIHALEGWEGFLEEEEQKLIDAVFNAFTWHGPKSLSRLMEDELSDLKISRDRFNNKIISKDSLKAYFKEICDNYEINQLEDIGNYPDRSIIRIRGLS